MQARRNSQECPVAPMIKPKTGNLCVAVLPRSCLRKPYFKGLLFSLSLIIIFLVLLSNNNVRELAIFVDKFYLPGHSAASLAKRQMTPRPLPDTYIDWCQPLGFKIKPGLKVALASFPGSGNTWFRYLIQQASGIYTGSIYLDKILKKNGFPGEAVKNGSVVVIKTHEFGPRHIKFFDKAILLVRDPFSAIQAEFNRQSGGHTGYASIEKYLRNNGKHWKTFVISKVHIWEIMNLAWADALPSKDRLVVFYDDLKNQTEVELRRALNFLNTSVSNEVMTCTMLRLKGVNKRSKKVLNFELFDSETRQLVAEHQKRVFQHLGRTVNHF